ncbi:NAD-dependent epimerase/dehydratase family protein [Actinoplanes siamensis]|uniref:NAD-dependent epimerase/dehydratase domain-containing protein n=1 Tax=Actinoplanes siamensis TaxID=1223317 RepID=A0A919N9X3_9ACTN|nr:NAD-dependent epimerase/dehydratase [Actinoplanes siamensis]GIF07053.1 hypothetical protein Asi03nite_45910 [Actinoplanes siamensis]
MSADTPGDTRQTIAVLGGTGSLGSAVAAALAERPVRVRLVGRGAPAALPAGQAEIGTVVADLTAPGAVEAAVRGADVVLCLVKHTGGWRDAGSREAELVNVGVPRALLDALARESRRPAPIVVYAGSASQAGPPARVPLTGTEPEEPDNAFDRQKLTAERLLLDASRAGVLRGVSLRLPMVYGGPVDKGVVTAMARRALAGGDLTVWDGGEARRDLVYVRDAAGALVAAIDHADALAGRHWLVGSGTGVRLVDLFSSLAATVAGHTARPAVPVTSTPAPAQATAGDLRDLVLDSGPFRSVTGWGPSTPLAEGLRATVAGLATRVAAS